jgi:hypothetical protein
MKKQKRSITIKIEDDGNPNEKFDPITYLETYIKRWRISDKDPLVSLGSDPNSDITLMAFQDGTMLTVEATWISTPGPLQALLGRVRRKAKSRVQKYVELCRLAGQQIVATVASVILAMRRLVFLRYR